MFTNDKMSLCTSHNTMQYWAREIKKRLKKSIKENNLDIIKDVIPIVDDIIQESRVAKKKGQNMEDRLRIYRNGIEKMGFQRAGRK